MSGEAHIAQRGMPDATLHRGASYNRVNKKADKVRPLVCTDGPFLSNAMTEIGVLTLIRKDTETSAVLSLVRSSKIVLMQTHWRAEDLRKVSNTSQIRRDSTPERSRLATSRHAHINSAASRNGCTHFLMKATIGSCVIELAECAGKCSH